VTCSKTILLAVLFAGAAFPIAAQQAAQQAPQQVDQARIERGLALYKSRDFECESCHGWAGRGKPADHLYGTLANGDPLEYGGNSLVYSQMTRDEMIMMLSCGMITGINIMPRYRGDAWTPAYPCWGKTAADIAPNEKPLGGPHRNMSPAEIELVVDYVQHVYQGKDMTWEWCRKYFDDFLRICEVWRERGIQ
jgi:mono/diheme cytochrome c family protein